MRAVAWAPTSCSGCSDDSYDPEGLRVAAADVEAVVFPATQDGSGTTDHHVANGVGWYFTDGASVGFFRAGDDLVRNVADTATGAYPEERLSWHTTGSVGGYRCGADKGLNGVPTWSRYVFFYP